MPYSSGEIRGLPNIQIEIIASGVLFGEEKGVFKGLQERIDGVFYKCEYLKECDKVTPQCRHGGNSYCGEYKQRKQKEKQEKLTANIRNALLNLGCD